MTMVEFPTIVADPPWPIRWTTGTTRVNGRGKRGDVRVHKRKLAYKTMSLDDICALNVEGVAAQHAHLYLWVPDEFLIAGAAARVAAAWGFEAKRLLLWCKRGYGMGTFPRPAHEALVFCQRGQLDPLVRNVGSWHVWKQPYENGARKHSAKPEGAYDVIERASPGPYLELFARRARMALNGSTWSYWGDESLQTVDLPALAAPPGADGAVSPDPTGPSGTPPEERTGAQNGAT